MSCDKGFTPLTLTMLTLTVLKPAYRSKNQITDNNINSIDVSSDDLQSAITDPRQKATFLAATAPHSGDWLSALPMASCGLRLDDESVRVAVALRLGLGVYVPHSCSCGQDVDAWGQHSLQQAFRFPRNRPASIVTVSNDRMESP